MMKRFDDFLDNVKKVNIEDEEFKRELKNKLFILYDKRKALKKRSLIIKSLSYAVVILLVVIPTFFILNKTFIQKPTVEDAYLVRTMKSSYEEIISKIIENDEILEEKLEDDGRLIKIYKSGIKIYEKDGNFEKILLGEENLIKYNIDPEYLINSFKNQGKESLTLDLKELNEIIKIFKTEQIFNFVNKDTIKNIININESLVIIKSNGERGDWIFLIDQKINRIIYFEYPYK